VGDVSPKVGDVLAKVSDVLPKVGDVSPKHHIGESRLVPVYGRQLVFHVLTVWSWSLRERGYQSVIIVSLLFV
jgi:hypothetical protein